MPLVCSHADDSFSFVGSSFKVEKTKESTGRVVVFKDFNILNSFTLECSFHGKQTADNKIVHFTIQDLRQFGSVLINQLENYLPSEELVLKEIQSKVLDIFYAEFIKFVPAYILKREQDADSGLKNSKTLTKSKVRLEPIRADPRDEFENCSRLTQVKNKIFEFESFVNNEYKKTKIKQPE